MLRGFPYPWNFRIEYLFINLNFHLADLSFLKGSKLQQVAQPRKSLLN